MGCLIADFIGLGQVFPADDFLLLKGEQDAILLFGLGDKAGEVVENLDVKRVIQLAGVAGLRGIDVEGLPVVFAC